MGCQAPSVCVRGTFEHVTGLRSAARRARNPSLASSATAALLGLPHPHPVGWDSRGLHTAPAWEASRRAVGAQRGLCADSRLGVRSWLSESGWEPHSLQTQVGLLRVCRCRAQLSVPHLLPLPGGRDFPYHPQWCLAVGLPSSTWPVTMEGACRMNVQSGHRRDPRPWGGQHWEARPSALGQ